MVNIEIKKRLKTFDMDVSLPIGRELTILTGPNGSGKTMLLRMVAGFERPDEGTISAGECVFFDSSTFLPPEKRRVGYVSQAASLFPWLTVEKNILFGLSNGRTKDTERWLGRLYMELNLGCLLKRRPALLSGGEAQRVMLARALAPKPLLLLLDEPFSAIDTSLKPRLRRFLKDIQKDWDIPVLMVTHDPAEAYTLGDVIFELVEGHIAEQREKGKVIKMPFISY
ncbi:MAG: ATP-binding cassette domain-containing protein [Deltaproteobacteria bacterium]|nr:ATP-binding cassette domain-containing protein [Deltaproteobacteria bacterium]